MAKYYTNEKAKFGGTTGIIIPFMKQLPSTNLPDQGNWKKYVPAGYLRCDGSIYKADLFPVLASIIGKGEDCKFKKKGIDLKDDEIQLPDLGSKYIRASNASGQYLNSYLAQDTTQLHVGAEVEIDSLVGDSVDISYAGNFTVVAQSDLKFSGNPIFVGDNDGYSADDFLSEDNFQAHGHDADNVGVLTYLGKWKDSAWQSNGGSGGNDARTEGSNNMVLIQEPTNGINNPAHNHQILLPTSAQYKTGLAFEYSYESTSIPADGLKSTLTLTTENIIKLDDAIMPYVIVEYIIKI